MITPPFSRNGGTASTAIQVHAIDLIEIRLVVSPPTRRTAIDGYPRIASYDMMGEQLYNCNPVKYSYAICLPHNDGGIPLSTLPKDTTSKLAGLFFTLLLFFMLSAKQESCEYHFLKSFGMTRLKERTQSLLTAKRTL